MEESRALNKLLEAADLVGMVEDLANMGNMDRLSSASLSGMRITLRNIREMVLAGHASLSQGLIARARVSAGNNLPRNGTETNGHYKSGEYINGSASGNGGGNGSSVGNGHSTAGSSLNSAAASTPAVDSQKIQMTRKDLRASLEKMIDNNNR